MKNKVISGELEGKFLMATPVVEKHSFFERSFIYIAHQNETEVYGYVVNKAFRNVTNVAFGDFLGVDKDILSALQTHINVHLGGPINCTNSVVFFHNCRTNAPDIMELSAKALTSENISNIKDELSKDVENLEQMILIFGCTKWSAKQFQAEIVANAWIEISYSSELVFGKQNKSKIAMDLLGFDPKTLISFVGRA